MSSERSRESRNRIAVGSKTILLIGLFAFFHLAPRPSKQNFLPPSSRNPNGVKISSGKNVRNHKNNGRIPKIIHLIYVSRGLEENQVVPADVLERATHWKSLHSEDWYVQLWDNAATRKAFPELMPTVSKIDTMAWVSDLLRYHILQRFGGIYLDTDTVGIRSLDPLLRYTAFTVCQSPMQNRSEYKRIEMNMHPPECMLAANGMIGSVPNHPALTAAIARSMQNTYKALERHGPNPPFSTDMSGPPVWNKMAYQTEVTYLRSFTFLPFAPWDGAKEGNLTDYQDDDRVFGMHLWDKSWRKQKGNGNH